MVAEVAATIGVSGANLVNSSACDWGSASSCITISVATVVVYCADLSNVRASVGNGA